jgi:hypothetical protein
MSSFNQKLSNSKNLLNYFDFRFPMPHRGCVKRVLEIEYTYNMKMGNK